VLRVFFVVVNDRASGPRIRVVRGVNNDVRDGKTIYIYLIYIYIFFMTTLHCNIITIIMKDGKSSRFMMIRGWRGQNLDLLPSACAYFVAIIIIIIITTMMMMMMIIIVPNICIAVYVRRIFDSRLYSCLRGQLQCAFCNRFLSLSHFPSLTDSFLWAALFKIYIKKKTMACAIDWWKKVNSMILYI